MRTWGVRNERRYRRFDPPQEELRALYKKMSMKKIADHYGVGETVVFMRLKEYGIGGIDRADRMAGVPKTMEHRVALSRARVGKQLGAKNPNWRGGKTRENLAARSRTSYLEWKRAVFVNSEWKCSKCFSEQGSYCTHCGHRVLLHAHHIKHFSEHPELRYEPSNGKALCERCHFAEHHKHSGELLEPP